MSKCEVGSLVRLTDGDSDQRGTVLSIKAGTDGYHDTAAVEWEDGELERVLIRELTVLDALQLAFEKSQAEINEKLDTASKLIREAGQMARKLGKELQDWDHDTDERMFNVDGIEGAMQSAGWRTSSWNC